MEPVTYLCGLTGLISGYLWFLYHNRDVSYASVIHTAASIRQQRLYRQEGFDIEQWRDLVEEGKSVRKEIQRIASEYNIDWDMSRDVKDSNMDAGRVVQSELRRDEKNEKSRRKEDLDDDGILNGSNELRTKP